MMASLDRPLPAQVPYLKEGRCRICRQCLARNVCRSKALVRIEPDEPPFVDGSRCYGCLACLPACPFEAIVVR